VERGGFGAGSGVNGGGRGKAGCLTRDGSPPPRDNAPLLRLRRGGSPSPRSSQNPREPTTDSASQTRRSPHVTDCVRRLGDWVPQSAKRNPDSAPAIPARLRAVPIRLPAVPAPAKRCPDSAPRLPRTAKRCPDSAARLPRTAKRCPDLAAPVPARPSAGPIPGMHCVGSGQRLARARNRPAPMGTPCLTLGEPLARRAPTVPSRDRPVDPRAKTPLPRREVLPHAHRCAVLAAPGSARSTESEAQRRRGSAHSPDSGAQHPRGSLLRESSALAHTM
jgi:hypothetical protein